MRQERIRRLISAGLLALLILIFSLTSEYFLTPNNIFTFLRDASVTGIIAVGVTFVIITAGIDLSTGALVAVVCMIAANILYYMPQVPVWAICILCVLLGAVGGYFNGNVVTRLKLPDSPHLPDREYSEAWLCCLRSAKQAESAIRLLKMTVLHCLAVISTESIW